MSALSKPVPQIVPPRPTYQFNAAKLLANVPQELQSLNHWIPWQYELKTGEWSKPPRTLKHQGYGSTTKPSDWSALDDVTAAVDADVFGDRYNGAGFVFSDTDFVGIEFDGVLTNGQAEPFVLAILEILNKPYCEISPSGTGLHSAVEGKLPNGVIKESADHYGPEAYDRTSPRYFTFTGEKFSGEGIPKIDELTFVVVDFLLRQFKDEKFKRAWCGDSSDYANDESRRDLALLGMLSRRLNTKDRATLERYFNASVPGHREKWTQRQDYRDRTFNKALGDKPLQQNDHDYRMGSAESWEPNENLTLEMVPLSQIKPEIQEWLWKNRIPMDALSNISGVADQGKSLVLYDILARISTGADFPDGAKNPFGRPRKVLLFFSEGSLKTTVIPRLMVMQGNMDNIIAIKSVKVSPSDDAQKRQFCLDKDLDMLRKSLAADPDIAVIAFDTITSYVGDERNINLPQDVRAVLTPLGEIAEEQHVTVVSIVHFSKNTLADAIHRTGGAGTWVDFPRASWCCSLDKSSDNRDTFVFSRIKSNLGKRIGGLTYRIEETFIDIDGKQTSEPKLVWGTGVVDRGADEVLGTAREKDKTDTDVAKEWLEANFPDDDARPAKTTKAAALHEGVSEDGFDRARTRLRMQSKPINGRWWMRRNQDKDNPWHEHPEESLSLDLPSEEEEVTL